MAVGKIAFAWILIALCVPRAALAASASAGSALATAGEDPNDVWLTEENWKDGMDPFRPSVKKKSAPPKRVVRPEPEETESAPAREDFVEVDVDPEANSDALLPRAKQEPVARTAFGPASGKLTLSPYYDFSKIRGTDKLTAEKFELTSKTGYGFRLQWTQAQTTNFTSRISAAVQSQKFKGPATHTLSESTPTQWALGLGGEYYATDWLTFDADVFAKHESFLRRASATELALDRLVIPQARLGFKAVILRSGGFTVGVAGEGDYYYLRGPKNSPTHARPGFGYGGALLLQQDFDETFAMGLTGSYLNRMQDTLATDQDEQNYRGSLDFIIRL